MLFDYQQGGMVLDGLMTFPDWSYGGIIAEETTGLTGTTGSIVLGGRAGTGLGGRKQIELGGGRQADLLIES